MAMDDCLRLFCRVARLLVRHSKAHVDLNPYYIEADPGGIRGVTTLAIGGAAAAVAYVLDAWLRTITG
jgi:hypothetical protein